jgi:hypothetical protein
MIDRELTVLETAISKASENLIASQTVLWTFAASTIYVASGSDVGEDLEGFQPLLFEREGTPILAIFSMPDMVGDLADTAPYLVTMTGEDLLNRMPADSGFVMNPRSDITFELLPPAIAAIRAELRG